MARHRDAVEQNSLVIIYHQAITIKQRPATASLERRAARERQLSTLKKGNEKSRGDNLSPRDKGKTRDRVAAAVGLSGMTYEKAKAVVEVTGRAAGRGTAGEDAEGEGRGWKPWWSWRSYCAVA